MGTYKEIMWKNEGGPSIKTNIWKIGILLYSLTDLHIFYIYIFSKEIGKFQVSCPFSEKWRGYSVCTNCTQTVKVTLFLFSIDDRIESFLKYQTVKML